MLSKTPQDADSTQAENQMKRKAASQSVYNSAIRRYYALHMEDLKRPAVAQHEKQAHLHTGVYAAILALILSAISNQAERRHFHFKRHQVCEITQDPEI